MFQSSPGREAGRYSEQGLSVRAGIEVSILARP